MQSSSSSSNANTASPLTFVDAGSDDSTVKPKRKRKRTMAGYQLKQTTTGTETFLPHQQQREPGTIPPIKLRRVTGNSWRVAGSSTGEQGSGVPLAGEPDMSADAASRGAAVVGSLSGNPPTASDNSPLTGDTQTSTIVQDMPEPMDMPGHIESVPLTTAPDLDKLISEFTVSQQNDLRTHLTKPEIQAVLNNAEILLKTLNDRNIKLSRDRGKPPAHSLFSKLKSLNIVKEPSIFSGYFARANVFFSAVNTRQITNTSCLTSMLNSKTHIKQFAEKSEETIQTVAANPCLKQICSMCHCKGLPDKAKVEDFPTWECWKVNGQFSLELLRAFSSMMSSKGLPDKGKVEDFLAWQCWKVNGEFSLKLLRAFSSMMSSKGLPHKAKVEDFLAWECWKVNGQFSLELLRIVSSMYNGKGLPDKAKVEDCLAWACWKVNGQFSLQLLRAFSSMMTSRGLPGKAKVEDFLAWECWKVNGQFSLELLRIFSSMYNGKGLPDKRMVEDFLAWACWKVNGEFSLERLRAFSSMCHGKGLPDKGKVEDFLAWACWKVNGQFSLERLRAVSSMCHSKGLPDKRKVEDFLAWECWKVNGQFNLKLLRIFSSMMPPRGLPDKGKVEDFLAWECWKVNGQFSLERLRVFSSMCYGKGLPDKGKVEDFLAWACWKVNGQFSLERLRAFSSMYNCKGLPDKAEVEDFLAWECWKVNGEFSLERLRAVSSMCHGKGLPDQAKVEAFFDWLPSDEKKSFLKLACRLFTGFGVPSREKLTDNEKTLRHYLKEYGYFTDSENDSSDEEDDLLEVEASQMRALALFFSAPAKWQMDIADFQQYLDLDLDLDLDLAASKSPRNQRMAVRAALTSLLPILAIHGGSGIRFWIKMYHKKPDCKELLTRALTIPAPLALTTFALTKLPESEGQEYIGLCRNMKPAPTPEQWGALKPLRQQLYQRFRNTPLQRMMLEILWSQSGDNRSKYTDRMDDLFQVVPTMTQWYRTYRAMDSQKKMQQFMDACLDYQRAPETAPEVRIQQRLLEGLLLANHYLTDHKDIPDLCFSSRVSGDDKTGVIVDGAGTMTGQERLWHFISAMLIELQQTEYQFNHQRLTLSPPDGQPVVLPTPEFTATVTGFVIKNWSLEQLNAFFKATEFTEQWYKAPQDKREHYAIRLEENLARMKARAQETKEAGKTEKTGHKKTGPLLSPSMIIGLIKQNKPLKSTVWSSLEHYASNGQLTGSLCKVLSPVIKREKEGVVPDIVKNTVAAKLSQSDTINTTAVSTIPQPLPSASRAAAPQGQGQASDNTVQPIATFKAAMDALDRFQVLGNAELEMLEVYREEMGTTQLMSVLKKINHKTVSQQTQSAWSTAFERRKKDPLGLEDIQEWDVDLSASDSEPQSEQWLEEILS